jgi:hypothetical protein
MAAITTAEDCPHGECIRRHGPRGYNRRMSLSEWARKYDELGPGEQAAFEEAIRRLLTDGFVWREDDNEADRKVFNFLSRREDLAREYLRVCGWNLVYHEQVRIYQAAHLAGAHRRRFGKDLTVWLLVIRLLYAEKREKLEASLARYPIASVGEVADRYQAFFPGQRVRKKTSLTEALRALQGLKLIRAVDGGGLRADDTDRRMELLPALEVALPAQDIVALAERLREYQSALAADDGAADEGDAS